jgi:hypothetical protein
MGRASAGRETLIQCNPYCARLDCSQLPQRTDFEVEPPRRKGAKVSKNLYPQITQINADFLNATAFGRVKPRSEKNNLR